MQQLHFYSFSEDEEEVDRFREAAVSADFLLGKTKLENNKELIKNSKYFTDK